MRTPQLLCAAAAAVAIAAGAACNRADTTETTQRAASEVRTAASTAGDRLADAWLTTQVQAKFFGDREIKARYIDVSTRDRIVTLQGYVPNDSARQLAVQLAKTTKGVREVQDQLMIGQAPARVSQPSSTGAVATSGKVEQSASNAAERIDDARITTMIQSKFFVDGGVKGRRIDVDTRGGIVTLRGDVASEAERAQALRLARETAGVQRVEDMLSVNASLEHPDTTSPDTTSSTAATIDNVGDRLDDGVVVTKLKAKLLADTQVKSRDIDVSVHNGIVTMQGTVPDAASKARALSLARDTDGVSQVVDRLVVGK
jgi:hyperosmotically inducible periplasmic protein